MKVLVTGANGQLAHAFKDQLANKSLQAFFLTKDELDITNLDSVKSCFKIIKPDYVINCAAFTNVDLAESERKLALMVNSEGAGNLAKVSNHFGRTLIHISTDYVFDGLLNKPYKESDNTNPINFYGETKLIGEEQVLQYNPNSIILRVSWLFSNIGKNFLTSMLALQGKDSIRIVSDQLGAPTSTSSIANTCMKIIQLISDKHNFNDWGVYHYSNFPYASWYDFASIIFSEAYSAEYITKIPSLIPITSKDYVTTALRPSNSRLNCEKIENIFEIIKTDWKTEVAQTLLQIYNK